jgi:transglutaminase-like putative cysteine protease
MSQEMAFRVDFPDGWVPEASSLYWRGAVLWEGDGLVWTRVPRMSSERDNIVFAGPAIRQRFMLEPHGMRWLFALDRAESLPAGAAFEAGGTLRSARPVHATLRYEVTSRLNVAEPKLLPQHRREASRRPSHVSPRLEALVASWLEKSDDSRAVVRAALQWFQDEDFTYTGDPGTYVGPGALDEFLFERRAGFCEHYAAAFATLMRVAGIPSRVVIGYQGGEFNRLGQYVIVRQSEAHAWSEAWIEGEGWMRVDPTSVIAPGRLTVGLGSFLTASGDFATDAGGLALGGRGLRGLLRDLRLAWDNVNFQWDLRVLGFDEDHQRELFSELGLPHGRWVPSAGWVLVTTAPVLIALGFWLRRTGKRSRDPVVAAWGRFCRALAADGVPRAPGEGPRTFTERAAAALPARAEEIRSVGALYIRERYGRDATEAGEFVRSVRALGR